MSEYPLQRIGRIDIFLLPLNINTYKIAEMYEETDKISDLISDDYRLLQVISRFRLIVDFGEKTVKEVCEKQKVNFHTFWQ